MHSLFYMFSPLLASVAAAAPLCPNITDTAGGDLPNSGLPTLISKTAIKEFQLVLFLENLETSFFQTGLSNLTNWDMKGYPNDTVEIVSKVAAQEEVHVATIISLLEAYNATLIPPCNYSFPVNSPKEFFELANLITSVGIGAIIGLSERLAATDPLLIKSISSIVTVESRHDASFRHIEGYVPNPAPFDTGISDIWAYNLALSHIVPGSCPVEVPVPILPTLLVSNSSTSTYANTTWEFTWDPMQMPFVAEADKALLVGWVNQLDEPVYTGLNITEKGKGTAAAPDGMNGAVFAVVTTQQPDNVNDLALATLAGPVVLTLS